MKKSKQTKRALLTSVLAMLVCLSMLVGSTFAWFTDSASTDTNQIVSGTLDVDLVDKDGVSLEGQTLDFVKANGVTEPILWEPGCTYNLPEIYIKNNGNLALKYKIVISGMDGSDKLLEAIEWTITKDGAAVDLATYEGHLAAGATDSGALVISGHMKEEVGNEYQGLEASGISITVLATQDTVEHDSIDNQYDKNAWEGVSFVANANELQNALTKGGQIDLLKDLNVEFTGTDTQLDTFNNFNDTVLNLNGKNIDFQDDSGYYFSPVMQYESNLVINGDGVITGTYGVIQAYYGSNITINGGTFIPQNGACIMVNCDEAEPVTVTINGGTFYADDYYWMLQTYRSIAHEGPSGTEFEDIYLQENQPGGSILVNGGTFVGTDPTPFVTEGHTVTTEVKDGVTWYTVVPA